MCPQAQAMGSVRNSAPSVLSLYMTVCAACCLLHPQSLLQASSAGRAGAAACSELGLP